MQQVELPTAQHHLLSAYTPVHVLAYISLKLRTQINLYLHHMCHTISMEHIRNIFGLNVADGVTSTP
jgi:hypothetical protein